MGARPSRALPISILLGLVVGCTDVEPSSSTDPPIAEPPITTVGSVTGTVRGSGTGYPNGNGNPGERALGWPLSGIAAIPDVPGQPERFAHEDYRTGSFMFDTLRSGRWTIRFLGLHPIAALGGHLYADTAITVTVEPNRTIDLGVVVPRPVDPFIVVAMNHCRWVFSSEPTLEDWVDCDGGLWGAPVDVLVEVNGVVGTPTSGRYYSFFIKAGQLSYELRDALPGDYIATVAPTVDSPAWRLAPWQNYATRLRVDHGIAYALFSFWRKVGTT
jgi:hypothetical protein